jgi:hypothetical protein
MKYLLLALAVGAALAGCAYPTPYGVPYGAQYSVVPSYGANGSSDGAPNVVLAPGYGTGTYSQAYPYGYAYPYAYGYGYPYGYGYGYPYGYS